MIKSGPLLLRCWKSGEIDRLLAKLHGTVGVRHKSTIICNCTVRCKLRDSNRMIYAPWSCIRGMPGVGENLRPGVDMRVAAHVHEFDGKWQRVQYAVDKLIAKETERT